MTKRIGKSGSERPLPSSKKGQSDRDRRVRQNARMARVLAILNLIQSRGRWNAKAIAEEVECSERTVYRDLEVLEFAGIPWYFDEESQSYRVRQDFKFPALALTDEELIGQALATSATRSPGLDINAGAVPTTRKLAAASPEAAQQLIADAQNLINVLDLKLADHSRHHEIIKTVQIGLLNSKQLVGLYESPYEKAAIRLKLHPYRLCLVKNAWYVIARSADEPRPRTYRIARFKTLRMTGEMATVPSDFSVQDYFQNAWGVYRGDKSYSVELWFTPEAAKVVTETTWHPTQKVVRNKDGSINLRFTVDGLEEIINWVLAWTGKCKVVQPSELRGRVAEKMKSGLAMNEGIQEGG